MAYVRRYRKGALITSLDELRSQDHVYHGNQIIHRGWFMSWQMSYAWRMIDCKALYRAELIQN